MVALDNGGDTLKCGYVTSESNAPDLIAHNYGIRTKRGRQVLLFDQHADLLDLSGVFYKRPVNRGYVLDWNTEEEIWRRALLSSHGLKVANPGDTCLVVNEAPFAPWELRTQMDEVVFESLGFAAMHKGNASAFAARGYREERRLAPSDQLFSSNACLVVDSGFSFSHATPVVKHSVLEHSARRIDVGSKLMTNFLKETVSFRTWNMMDEFSLMHDLLKRFCFVSTDFVAELKQSKSRTRSTLRTRLLLPNGATRLVAEETKASEEELAAAGDQTMELNNERIAVPELLLNPSDIGLQQGGLHEAIFESISSTPSCLHPSLYNNILLTGGNALIPGLADRLRAEVRRLAPLHCEVNVHTSSNPIDLTWRGMREFVLNTPDLEDHCVTKAEYEEHGSGVINYRKFQSLI